MRMGSVGIVSMDDLFSSACLVHLFGLASGDVFGCALERLGDGFRGSWGVLGASWERLGPSWGRLGGLQGRLGREDEL